MNIINKTIDKHKVLLVVPTFNNVSTIAKVISDIKEYSENILIINDGSTDNSQEIIEKTGTKYISYTPNKGKGYAIKQALKYAFENDYNYILTIDSDGQHFASDIENFINKLEEVYTDNKLKHTTAKPVLIIGARNLAADNMPSKNTFANKFSNFWYHVETGNKLVDTQSGMRLYPVKALGKMKFISNRYEFEVEVIVRSAWKGIDVINIPIKVYYPPTEERISHFKPLKDFTRISILNTLLVIIALLYYYPWKFIRAINKENITNFIKNNITESKESNTKIASAMGLGIFFGIFPIWGYQMIVAAIVAHWLKLNKIIVLISSNISIPPMIPFILYGSFYTGAIILGRKIEINFQNISFENVYTDLLQYFLGATVFAAICATTVFIITLLTLTIFRKRN